MASGGASGGAGAPSRAELGREVAAVRDEAVRGCLQQLLDNRDTELDFDKKMKTATAKHWALFGRLLACNTACTWLRCVART